MANGCFYLALVLLYRLLCLDFEPTLASRALFYLACSPYALFFFAGYTESFSLLLSAAVFLLLRRGRIPDLWLAGLLGFLAVLTRSPGLLLAIPMLVVALQRVGPMCEQMGGRWLLQFLWSALPVLLLPAGLLVYMLYLALTQGNALLFVSHEAAAWGRHLDLPWSAFPPAIGALFTHPLFSNVVLQNAVDLTFTLLPLVLLAVGWRLLPPHYRLYVLGLALFSLCFPVASGETLASQPRYLFLLFPIFLVLAFWGKRPRFDRVYSALSCALLALNVALFVTHHWVA